jgi:hypothetical protein
VFSTWVGVVLLFGVFGLFVWVVIGASQRGDTYEAKRATARAEKLKTLREEANKALTTYGWVDKAKGVTRIPIDRAMELTLADLVGKKPAPANPVVAPEPQASAAPAPNAVPPKAGGPSPSSKPTGSAPPKPTAVEGPNSAGGGQPAAAVKPAPAPPATQPGPSATPAASPGAPSAQAPQSPSPVAATSPAASPLPVRGKTP